jgi:hypothetical protein
MVGITTLNGIHNMARVIANLVVIGMITNHTTDAVTTQIVIPAFTIVIDEAKI